MTKKVLVTGAPGFVGSHLCKELVENGYEVHALHRKTSNLENIKDLNIKLCEGDITDIDSISKYFNGIDIVFHIAALFREAKHTDETYKLVNIEGVRNVFEAAIEAKVPRIIHCSTVGVHSHIPNPPADENEEFRPGDIYQETKCEGEKLALKYFKSGKIRGAIIRPAMIWGPGDSRMKKLFYGIAKNKLPLIGNGKTLVHWVLVSDLARAFRLAGEKEEINEEIFIIAGRDSVPMLKLFKTIGEAYGKKAPFLKIPALPIQLLGTIVETICIPIGIEPPIYRRRVDFFTKTRCFNSSKAEKLLGYLPSNSFEKEVELIAKSFPA